jgi:hypothetical protein
LQHPRFHYPKTLQVGYVHTAEVMLTPSFSYANIYLSTLCSYTYNLRSLFEETHHIPHSQNNRIYLYNLTKSRIIIQLKYLYSSKCKTASKCSRTSLTLQRLNVLNKIYKYHVSTLQMSPGWGKQKCCLLWEPYETRKSTLWAECRILLCYSKWYVN